LTDVNTHLTTAKKIDSNIFGMFPDDWFVCMGVLYAVFVNHWRNKQLIMT